MKIQSSFEKGMEALEQGGKTVKQQVKAQITGQQPTQQNGQQPRLDSFKEQVLGVPNPQPKLDTVQSQLTGIPDTKPHTPSPVDAQVQNVAQQAQDDQFKNDLYGVPKDQQEAAQMQQTLDPQNMAKKAQDDQQKLADAKKHMDNYYRPEFEQKPEEMRRQAEQQDKQEEKVEEQQKMDELQVKEKNKDEDMRQLVLSRQKNKAEIKGGGG